MAQDIFIGVDGSATKSRVRIEDETGKLLGQAVGGPANIRISVEGSWQSIYQALEDVLKPQRISLHDKNYHFHVGMGLAGWEVAEARRNYLNHSHPFTSIQLMSDAHTACLGAHNGEDGAIIVVGTSVVGYQIEVENTTKVGGWGFPHDDEGGGAWLGLEAVRLTFQWLDHRIEKCPLVEDVFAYFNHDLEHFAAWVNRAGSDDFARLAPIVINHGQQEEPAAVRILKKSAHAINRIATGLEKTQKNRDKLLPCCLFGGIAPFIEPWLDEELRARLVSRKADANKGAILMIRNKNKAQR